VEQSVLSIAAVLEFASAPTRLISVVGLLQDRVSVVADEFGFTSEPFSIGPWGIIVACLELCALYLSEMLQIANSAQAG
jgi:hypothetical protein